MAPINLLTLGWISPALSYGLSLVGSVLGLTAIARSRYATRDATRVGWLAIAAFAIGGSTIWTSHFVAMTGFSAGSLVVRYDVADIVKSWLVGVIFVGLGLLIGGSGRSTWGKVIVAGIFCGFGESSMHIFANAAMRMPGTPSFDNGSIGVSVLVSIVTATVVLRLTLKYDSPVTVAVGSVVLTTVIVGMHYLVMRGMRIHLHPVNGGITGVAALMVIAPVVLMLIVLAAMLFYALIAASSHRDAAQQDELDRAQARGAGLALAERAEPRRGEPRRGEVIPIDLLPEAMLNESVPPMRSPARRAAAFLTPPKGRARPRTVFVPAPAEPGRAGARSQDEARGRVTV